MLTCHVCETEYVREDDLQPEDTCDDCVDGAPCCPDPGCAGNPCTFPGFAAND